MLDARRLQETASFVEETELRGMMEQVSRFGGGPAGAVTRLALSDADRDARDWLAEGFAQDDLELVVDAVGNMFGISRWAGSDAPTIMTGSHLDSQPNGGRFDGTLGVVAACAAVRAVKRRLARSDIAPKVNLAVVNWTNEEGARFQPSLLGSGVFAGEIELAVARSRTDADDVSVAEELCRIGYDGVGTAPIPAALIELHVEGATALERSGRHFATFTRFWGATKYRLVFIGSQAHTGPTPMAERRDALLAGAHLVVALRAMADRFGPDLHTSMGRLEVVPNSPNVVPARATCFVELRSASPDILADAERDLVEAIDAAAAAAGVKREILTIDKRRAGTFDTALVQLATRVAADLGHTTMRLDTVAGHDGVSLAAVCPSLVMAVPSVGGVMHHPDEYTSEADCLLGTRILAEMLWHFVENGTMPAAATAR